MYMYIVPVPVTATYHMYMYMYMYMRLKLEALGSVLDGCPILFSFSQRTSLCWQNRMMFMSALVQVAAVTGALVQVAAIISALVQFVTGALVAT